MNRGLRYLILLAVLSLALPSFSEAALVWRRGEGWAWERGGVPLAANPKEQLEFGRGYEQKKEWDMATACYRRLLKKWPTSAFASEAQYRIGYCLEQQDFLSQAVEAYQKAIERYPNTPQFRDILQRQYEIGNRFLEGAHHKVWKLRIFPGLEKGIGAYEKVIHNAPYGELAPDAQYRIGLIREKRKEWPEAVQAFQTVLDKYFDSESVDDAMYALGLAYFKQSRSAEYDQNAAYHSADAFVEFIGSYPEDPRVAEAKKNIRELEVRNAEGLYKIARYYDRKHKETAALIYYSELVRQHRDTEFAQRVIPRMEVLKTKQLSKTPAANATASPVEMSRPAPPPPMP